MPMTGWRFRVNCQVRRRPGSDAASRSVAELFGLTPRREVLYRDFRLRVRPGQIVAVVGPSGAGKSVLLNALARQAPRAIRLRIEPLARSGRTALGELLRPGRGRRVPFVRVQQALGLLARCGLAEAAALATPARRLSGGQLYRLALAKALWQASRARRPTLVLADEFAAVLDATTAEIVAAQLRKLVSSRPGLAVILSTPRHELLGPLAPDAVVVKPLGEPPQLSLRPARLGRGPRPSWAIAAGRIGDYRALAAFHYLAGPPAAHKRVWVVPVPPRLRRPGGPALAAVLVVSPPVIACRGRNVATGGRYTGPRRAGLARLNREIECISRVIVHPAFRSCGLAVRLVRHALATAQMPLVEALAGMGAVHPFFKLAGLRFFGRFQGRSRTYNYYLGRSSVPWGQAERRAAHV